MDKFGVSQSVTRVEDQRLLTGQGRFTGNLSFPGEAHLVLVRSPHAHARIVAVETAEAAAASGVVAVYTGADLTADGIGAVPYPPLFKRPDGGPMTAPPREVLASKVVRYVGEPVVAVVAESRAQAEDAAELVWVDYEELPAVVDPMAALQPEAPVLWAEAPDNIAAEHRHGEAAATTAAFEAAHHVARLEIVNNRLIPSAMEPRAAACLYDTATDRYVLHTGCQNPTTVRAALAEAVLKIPVEKLRVLVGDIGGGFGMKAGMYPEDAIVAYAAGKLRRPVVWRGTRSEEFLSGTHGRDAVTTAELALDADGRILGMRAETVANVGAHMHSAGAAVPLMLGPRIATGVYRVPALDLTAKAVLTNTAVVAPYRGAGRPEAIYIVERLIDQAAWETGVDPADLRRRNMVAPAELPYTNATGETYADCDFPQLLDSVLERADWSGFPARRAAAEQRGRLLGRGIAAYVEWTGANQLTEQVQVRIEGEGRVVLQAATQAMGQGLDTTYSQLVANGLGVPLDRISVVQGDTDLVQGFGSMASRSLFVGGSAVAVGTENTVARGRELAAEALEASAADIEFADGRYTVSGTDLEIGLFELATRQPGNAFAVDTSNTVPGASWPSGCHVCELEVDPETGAVEIARYTALDDVGIAINPMIVDGQVHGGLAQGIGQALLERTVYDPESGQLLTGSYMDYCMPRADDLPAFDTGLDQSRPSTTNPLGAKGSGEIGAVAAPPAVINALIDALRPLGVQSIDMPATPQAVWAAIAEGKGR